MNTHAVPPKSTSRIAWLQLAWAMLFAPLLALPLAAQTTLQNGTTVSSISGSSGSTRQYKITVPSGQSLLTISISGGSGDCDLYVRRGAAPTTSTWDYRPYESGNNETVAVANPASGDWFVMLHGYEAYSGVSLVAAYSGGGTVATPSISPASGTYTSSAGITMSTTTSGASIYYTLNGTDPTTSSTLYTGAFTLTSTATVKARAFKSGMNASGIASRSYTITIPVTTITSGVPVTSISGAQDSLKLYKISVPSGQSLLTISISGGTGDCDLYVRRGSQPTTSSYDYAPFQSGNTETVSVSSPVSDDWYVTLHGYNAYSGVTLVATYGGGTVATPTFSPAPGGYSGSVVVSLSTATSGATIRYTLNGVDPTSSSTVYSGPFTLTTTTTVKARAFKSGMSDSAVATGTYTAPPVAATLTDEVPVTGIAGAQGSQRFYKISVPAGQSSLTFKTSGGSGDVDQYVRYGSQPTTSSYGYFLDQGGNNETITIPNPASGDWYVMVYGYSTYSGVSLVADYGAVITPVATPVISPGVGTYSGSVAVSLSTATSGATIRYTLNGVDPTSSSTVYSGPFTLTTTTTVKARAFKSGMSDSAVATGTYTVTPVVVTLTDEVPVTGIAGAQGSQRFYKISVPAGQSSLTFKTSGGSGDVDQYVRYGSQPTTSSYGYFLDQGGNNETITIPNPASGDWYVMLYGYSTYSGVSLVADYGVVVTPVATPTFSPAPGTYIGSVSVSLSTTTSGATLRYTLNGTTPTSSSTLYTGPFTLTSTTTVKARGFKTGMSDSAVATGSYTVTPAPPTTLTDEVPVTGIGGAQGSQRFYKITVPSGQSSLTIKTSGGTGDVDQYVRYGSSPTTSSYGYFLDQGGNNETITIPNPASGDWYVMLYGYSTYSGVTLVADYAAVTPVATPVISPGVGTYSGSVAVSLSCATSGATIRYTLNGTDPTGSSTVYSGPFTLTSTTTVKARGFKSGMSDSAVATKSYSIAIPTETILANGAPVTATGTAGSTTFYKITVPSGQSLLTISISGGTGDCDLYVKRGERPTLSIYDNAPFLGGNNETVTVNNPQSGDWYVMLHGFESYSGLTLTATYSARVLLLLHGINSGPNTWNSLTQEMFNNQFRDIFGGSLPTESSPLLAKDGVFCYRVDFGAYDEDFGNSGLDGITSTSAPLPSGGASPLDTGEANTAGDFTDFVYLGLEIKQAIDKLITRHGAGLQVVLLGHSRGGLAARSFLQNQDASYTAARQKVVSLLTTGTPHRGTRLAKIYPYLEQNPHPATGGLPQDWKVVEFLIKSDGELDVRRPVTRDLAFGSTAISNLNASIGNIPSAVKCSGLVYRSVPLGQLDQAFGYEYSIFDSDLIGGKVTTAARNYLLGTGNSPSDFMGDGTVEADNQSFTNLSGFSADSVSETAISPFFDLYHTDEPGRKSELKTQLKKLVDWWGN